MKCPKCGSEIKEQMLYCSVCGEEIKMVPDYDAAVDDNIQLSITGVIDRLDIEDNAKAPTRELISNTIEALRNPRRKDAQSGPKISKRSILVVAAVVLFFVVSAGIVIFSVSRYYSFEYQYEKALEEFDNSEYLQSIKTIRHALSIDNSMPKIKLLLVDNYLELNKYDEALAVLYELLSQYPEDVNIYDKIAKIYEETGDSEAISQLVERADIESFTNSYSEYAKPQLNFSVPAGEYDDVIELSFICDDGCTIYYTRDGSEADNTKLLYSSPIELDSGEHTINAVCYSANGVVSDMISGTYVISFAVPDMPVPSVQSGEYTEPKLIGVTYGVLGETGDGGDHEDITSLWKCYYTIDGDDPTEDDILYDAPFAMYIGKHNYKFVVITEKGIRSEVYNLDITLNVVNLVDMGTATGNLEIWLTMHGLNAPGGTYKCEQAYMQDGMTYYIINEYTDKKTGVTYGVDVITGMAYKAKRDTVTGEYNLEPVIKPL